MGQTLSDDLLNVPTTVAVIMNGTRPYGHSLFSGEQPEYTEYMWSPLTDYFEGALLDRIPGDFPLKYPEKQAGILRVSDTHVETFVSTGSSTRAPYACLSPHIRRTSISVGDLYWYAFYRMHLEDPSGGFPRGNVDYHPYAKGVPSLVDIYMAKVYGLRAPGDRTAGPAGVLYLFQEATEDDQIFGLRTHLKYSGPLTRLPNVGAWMNPLPMAALYSLSRIRNTALPEHLARLPYKATSIWREHHEEYAAWLFRIPSADKHLKALLTPNPPAYEVTILDILRVYAKAYTKIFGGPPRPGDKRDDTDLKALKPHIAEMCLEYHPTGPTRDLVHVTQLYGKEYLQAAGVYK